MPVRKYRTMEEAEADLWMSADDPRLLQVIRGLWERSYRLSPMPGRPGLRRFRSMEEANRDTEEWIREGMDFMEARRRTAGESGSP